MNITDLLYFLAGCFVGGLYNVYAVKKYALALKVPKSHGK